MFLVLTWSETTMEYICNFLKAFISGNCCSQSFSWMAFINILRKILKSICYLAAFYYKGLQDRYFHENFFKFLRKDVLQNILDREVNAPLTKCGRNNSSRFFSLNISNTLTSSSRRHEAETGFEALKMFFV